MTNQDEEERKHRNLIEKRAYAIYEQRGGHHRLRPRRLGPGPAGARRHQR